MMVSLAVSVLMLTGKLTAYGITHSAAMLADAAESVVHGVATAFAAFSLWYAAKPADDCHPYGHGRIVYFSTGFEGALVLAASIAVVYSGFEGLIIGTQLKRLGLGLIIAGALALINLILGIALISIGKRHNALVLIANGQHVLSDFWTTAGAILGVSLVKITGIQWFDPVAAIALGMWIMFSGISLIRQSFSGLMDSVEPAQSQQLAEHLRQQVRDGRIADFHQLRSRLVNDEVWIDVHMLLPGDLPLAQAHARVTEVEESMRSKFSAATVHIATHIEPADHDAAHPGGHSSP